MCSFPSHFYSPGPCSTLLTFIACGENLTSGGTPSAEPVKERQLPEILAVT